MKVAGTCCGAARRGTGCLAHAQISETLLAVATFAAAAAADPCASTKATTRRALRELVLNSSTSSTRSTTRSDANTVTAVPRRDPGRPAAAHRRARRAGAAALRGHQLFWPSGAPAVLTGFNMQFSTAAASASRACGMSYIPHAAAHQRRAHGGSHWGDSTAPSTAGARAPPPRPAASSRAASVRRQAGAGDESRRGSSSQRAQKLPTRSTLAAATATSSPTRPCGRSSQHVADARGPVQVDASDRGVRVALEPRAAEAGGGGERAYAKTCMAVAAAIDAVHVGATRFYNRNRLQALPDASGVLKDAVICAFNFYVQDVRPRPQRTRLPWAGGLLRRQRQGSLGVQASVHAPVAVDRAFLAAQLQLVLDFRSLHGVPVLMDQFGVEQPAQKGAMKGAPSARHARDSGRSRHPWTYWLWRGVGGTQGASGAVSSTTPKGLGCSRSARSPRTRTAPHRPLRRAVPQWHPSVHRVRR